LVYVDKRDGTRKQHLKQKAEPRVQPGKKL
jgi:hypothetical protein